MPKKLLILGHPFGVNTDYYYYTKHLKSSYKITYLSFKNDSFDVRFSDVNYIEIPYLSNRFLRWILVSIVAFAYIIPFNGAIFISSYFGKLTPLTIFKKRRRVIFDIRSVATGYGKDEKSRISANNKLSKWCNSYHNVSVISEQTADSLSIVKSKRSIIPLGANVFYSRTKKFETLSLLYVGTLNNRRIDITIKGLKLFLTKNPNVKLSYDIIGTGDSEIVKTLNDLVTSLNLSSCVTFHGYIPQDNLSRFFEKCNLGISFVPKTDYYNHQPPTKTYEYILSGLFCIATSTAANSKLICMDNGVLIEDTSESFAKGLSYCYENKNILSSDSIRQTLSDSTWENVIKTKLEPLLEKCLS